MARTVSGAPFRVTGVNYENTVHTVQYIFDQQSKNRNPGVMFRIGIASHGAAELAENGNGKGTTEAQRHGGFMEKCHHEEATGRRGDLRVRRFSVWKRSPRCARDDSAYNADCGQTLPPQ